MNAAVTTLNVGMLGCGVVGSNVARLLQEDSGDFAARSGATLKLSKVAVKNINAKREFVPNEILTADANSVVTDPNIQIVIEVMGGIEPARELILTAIKMANQSLPLTSFTCSAWRRAV